MVLEFAWRKKMFTQLVMDQLFAFILIKNMILTVVVMVADCKRAEILGLGPARTRICKPESGPKI